MSDSLCVIFLVLTVALAIYCNPVIQQKIVKHTENGPIEGIELRSSLNQKYFAFRGVPYAEPPITGVDPNTGRLVDRRFKAPMPLGRNWTEKLEAHDFADFCITSSDIFQMKAKTSENCLFLNIYVPAGGSGNKTVLVWIHGGAYVGGDPNSLVYGPDFLLSEDNIVVTIQYRLAIFGFLSLGFGEYTGNMGLKDQQMALKWIFKNIENFSGNKHEILLFGESAGGSSANLHMLNEESRKYFNRVYIGSGSAINEHMFLQKNHIERMQNFTGIANLVKMIEYLKTANSDSLDNCGEMNSLLAGQSRMTLTWTPILEDSGTIGAFITEPPEEIYRSGKVPAIDSLFSFTSQEYIMMNPEIVRSTEALLTDNLKESKFQLPFNSEMNEMSYVKSTRFKELEHALRKLKNAHFPNNISIDAIRHGNINLLSEMNMVDAILKAVVLQTDVNNKNKNMKKRTFLFRFSVDADLNVFKVKRNLKFDGATHAEDLCYYFHCHHLDPKKVYENHLEQRDMPYDIITRMVKMITQFARTGNPSVEGDTPFRACESSAEIYCQEISNNSTSTVSTNIMEQLHHDIWREIEQSSKQMRIVFGEDVSQENNI